MFNVLKNNWKTEKIKFIIGKTFKSKIFLCIFEQLIKCFWK